VDAPPRAQPLLDPGSSPPPSPPPRFTPSRRARALPRAPRATRGRHHSFNHPPCQNSRPLDAFLSHLTPPTTPPLPAFRCRARLHHRGPVCDAVPRGERGGGRERERPPHHPVVRRSPPLPPLLRPIPRPPALLAAPIAPTIHPLRAPRLARRLATAMAGAVPVSPHSLPRVTPAQLRERLMRGEGKGVLVVDVRDEVGVGEGWARLSRPAARVRPPTPSSTLHRKRSRPTVACGAPCTPPRRT